MNYVLMEPPLLTLVGGHLVRKFKPRIRRSGVDWAVDPSNVPRTAGHISRKGGGGRRGRGEWRIWKWLANPACPPGWFGRAWRSPSFLSSDPVPDPEWGSAGSGVAGQNSLRADSHSFTS